MPETAPQSVRTHGRSTASDSETEWRRRAKRAIPGGCHTYSKGDDQFPGNAPALIVRGKGCRVWGSDGREYLDWGMGLRSVVLGHAYEPVLSEVRRQLELGANFVRPSPLEVELAEELLGILPGADMVKFAKNGSDVTSAAVRLARAYTGRDFVAYCRTNPFYSFDDWFIGTTTLRAGIPADHVRFSIPFDYGDLDGLRRLLEAYEGRVAAIIIEPAAMAPLPDAHRCGACLRGRPENGRAEDCRNRRFLEGVRRLADSSGAVLVFDEMITGFRWDVPGAQTLYDVRPDLSCFGKALGNGFSVAALAGPREIMELGGRDVSWARRVFLLSATHGGETHALAAARAVLREMREQPVIEHLWRVGSRLQTGLNEASRNHGLQERVWCDGYPCSPNLHFLAPEGETSLRLRTLFLQEMARRGVLVPYVAPSFSHSVEDVEETVAVADQALRTCAEAFHRGWEDFSEGETVSPVFGPPAIAGK